MTPRIYYFSLFLILGGCVAKVPAPPAAETLEVPEQFMHSGNVTISLSTSSPTAWWEVYQDSKLNALETEAVHHNATLAKAYAHVHEARALRDMATGGREPELSAHLSGQLAGQTEERSIPGSSRTYRVSGDSYRSSLNVSYELDLWGRVKLTLESVEAQLAASEADQRSVALAISCEVAQSWLTLRILASENLILSEHQQCCRESLQLAEVRQTAGLTNSTETQQALIALAALDSQLIMLSVQQEKTRHALAVLTGVAPSALLCDAESLETLITSPSIPEGLPSALLLSRPDLIQARALVQAQEADLGIADSARFPAISLTGSAGFASADLGKLIRRPSLFWEFGPSISLPIFNGGRIKGNIRASQARLEAAQANLRQQSLVAFKEVEDALITLQGINTQIQLQSSAVEAAKVTYDIFSERYQKGLISFGEVLQAQKSLLVAKRSKMQLLGSQHSNTLFLIKALGASWETAQ